MKKGLLRCLPADANPNLFLIDFLILLDLGLGFS
jgi:hypothetical protein